MYIEDELKKEKYRGGNVRRPILRDNQPGKQWRWTCVLNILDSECMQQTIQAESHTQTSANKQINLIACSCFIWSASFYLVLVLVLLPPLPLPLRFFFHWFIVISFDVFLLALIMLIILCSTYKHLSCSQHKQQFKIRARESRCFCFVFCAISLGVFIFLASLLCIHFTYIRCRENIHNPKPKPNNIVEAFATPNVNLSKKHRKL